MGTTYPNEYQRTLLDRLLNPAFKQLRTIKLNVVVIPGELRGTAEGSLSRHRKAFSSISRAMHRLDTYRFERPEVATNGSATAYRFPYLQVNNNMPHVPVFTKEGWKYCLMWQSSQM